MFRTFLAWLLLTSASLAQITEWYVDPNGGSDMNAGTSEGAAWATLEFAVSASGIGSSPSTDGDRINLKYHASSETTLTGALGASMGFSPTAAAPLVIRGYDATAGDQGGGSRNIPVINGDGSASILDNTTFVTFEDCILDGATCSNEVIVLGNYSSLIRCIIRNNTGSNEGIEARASSFVINCEVDNVGGDGIQLNGVASYAYANYIHGYSGDGIESVGIQGFAVNNIISCGSGTNNGINVGFDITNVVGNSILTTGSGTGIVVSSASDRCVIVNNLIEVASGTGVNVNSNCKLIYRNNAVYVSGAGTAYNNSGLDALIGGGTNATLTATPFAKSGSDTDANRFVYYAPVDANSNVFKAAYVSGMNMDLGAVQDGAAAGGTVAPKVYGVSGQ